MSLSGSLAIVKDENQIGWNVIGGKISSTFRVVTQLLRNIQDCHVYVYVCFNSLILSYSCTELHE